MITVTNAIRRVFTISATVQTTDNNTPFLLITCYVQSDDGRKDEILAELVEIRPQPPALVGHRQFQLDLSSF